jgi:DNA-binding LacI/PurR family transcriptional regulator
MLAEAGVDEGITIHTASATRALAATPQRPRGFTYEPVVRHILSFRDATALLVPHDYTAYYFYHILTSRGVAIPRQLSVLSFDNSDRLVALPLSTIDFGFGYLGYAAFHTIFGVIKPLRTHEGDIAAKPYLVDRGSVAVPRSGSLRLRRGGPGWERLR